METGQLDLNAQWIEILATLVALAWAFFRGSAMYKSYSEKLQWDKDEKITNAIEAAVTQTYQNYVRQKQEQAAFDADAKNTAHQMAVSSTINKLQSQGITDVTTDEVTAGVARAVSSMKPEVASAEKAGGK
jgi:hypothetical protein